MMDNNFEDGLRDFKIYKDVSSLLWDQHIKTTSISNTILITIQCITCITTLLLNGHTYLRGLLLGINLGCLTGVIVSNLVSNHFRRQSNNKFETEVFPFIKTNLK